MKNIKKIKKINIGFILIILLVALVGCSKTPSTVNEEPIPEEKSSEKDLKSEENQEDEPIEEPLLENFVEEKAEEESEKNEIIGVWISYLDLEEILRDKNEAEVIKEIDLSFAKLKSDGFNAVYLQIRPFSDAIYYSTIYPFSHLFSSEKIQGIDPGYDLLKLYMDAGKSHEISIHGWINPYRISLNGIPKQFSKNNIFYNDIMESKDFIILKNGEYINPASEYGRKMVVDGVMEAIEKYDLDGIQFDDYFYPTTNKNADDYYYTNYKANKGELSLDDWRRENVNILISDVRRAIKDYNVNIVFGISPDANIEKNFTTHYADIELWVKNGYVDYLLPQVYFGFDHETLPFEQTIESWQKIVAGSKTRLIIGLGPYKIGLLDNWAGESGKNEWIDNNNLLSKKLTASRNLASYDGVCLFRYGSIYSPSNLVKLQVETEMENFLATLGEQ